MQRDRADEAYELLLLGTEIDGGLDGGVTGSDGSERATKTRSSWGECSLFAQHASSTLTAAAYDFALFLYLAEAYPTSIVPASSVGLLTKLCGLMFANHMGGLVDRYPRVGLVRCTIAAQKGFKLLTFAFLAGLVAGYGVTCLVGVAVCSASLSLGNTTLEVAVERDWVTTIAIDSEHLTLLNTRMRRIDLLSKLMAPLAVSLLTTLLGYNTTLLVLTAWVILTCVAEYMWVQVVYHQLPALSRSTSPRDVQSGIQLHQGEEGQPPTAMRGSRRETSWLEQQKADWAEFMRMPIFASSLAIASIYLTTLSYDGTFIAYVKVARGHGDAFIAAMRGVCVLTGLLGTAAMPMLERRIGLVRAGMWSITFELCCLLPAMLAFFVGAGAYGENGPMSNQIFLFGGIALSRVGLWSFDLCQYYILIGSRWILMGTCNRTNRQIALQNTFDLLKYAMTLAAARPAEFKWTALGSVVAVAAGVACYAVYLRGVRGHLIHLDWCKVHVH